MTTTELQIWVGILGSLVTIIVSVLGVLNFQTRRLRAAAVGSAFRDIVDGLAAEDPTRRMAAAILIRRFFDKRSEQGAARQAYAREAAAVMAGLLRKRQTDATQKVLADGLRYAPSLRHADLQQCNLAGAYWGSKEKRGGVDITEADFFKADLAHASLKNATASRATFLEATLIGTVLIGADLTNADFRKAHLDGANFDGAVLDGARFAGAVDIPDVVERRLDDQGRVVGQVQNWR